MGQDAQSVTIPPAISAHRLRLCVVAGLMLPGLGHWLMRRRGHALAFGLAIYGLFIGGMLLSGGTAIDAVNHEVYWVMQLAVGIPTWLVHWGGLGAAAELGERISIDAQRNGMSYLALAGLCNMLALLELLKRSYPQAEARP